MMLLEIPSIAVLHSCTYLFFTASPTPCVLFSSSGVPVQKRLFVVSLNAPGSPCRVSDTAATSTERFDSSAPISAVCRGTLSS